MAVLKQACSNLASGIQKLLKCLDMWVGGTSATQYSKNNNVRGFNKCKCDIRKRIDRQCDIHFDPNWFQGGLQNITGSCYGKAMTTDVQVNNNFNYNCRGLIDWLKNAFPLWAMMRNLCLLLHFICMIVFDLKMHIIEGSCQQATLIESTNQENKCQVNMCLNKSHCLLGDLNKNMTW